MAFPLGELDIVYELHTVCNLNLPLLSQCFSTPVRHARNEISLHMARIARLASDVAFIFPALDPAVVHRVECLHTIHVSTDCCVY
jgi:hypothetical protein